MRMAKGTGRARECHHACIQPRSRAAMRATLVQRSAESIEFAPRATPGEYQAQARGVQYSDGATPVRKGATQLASRGAGVAAKGRYSAGSGAKRAGPAWLGTCYTVCTMVRGLLAATSLCVVMALAAGCASPTLPLPPPMEPTIGAGVDADHVKLTVPCGGASPGAIIVVVNTNTSVPPDQAVSGSLVSACGAWDAVVYAHAGDFLTITQEIGTDRSQPTTVEVQAH